MQGNNPIITIPGCFMHGYLKRLVKLRWLYLCQCQFICDHNFDACYFNNDIYYLLITSRSPKISSAILIEIIWSLRVYKRYDNWKKLEEGMAMIVVSTLPGVIKCQAICRHIDD